MPLKSVRSILKSNSLNNDSQIISLASLENQKLAVLELLKQAMRNNVPAVIAMHPKEEGFYSSMYRDIFDLIITGCSLEVVYTKESCDHVLVSLANKHSRCHARCVSQVIYPSVISEVGGRLTTDLSSMESKVCFNNSFNVVMGGS